MYAHAYVVCVHMWVQAEQKLRQVEAEQQRLQKQLLESKKQERENKRRVRRYCNILSLLGLV